ncbi:CLUMA_CG004160, isoform C [Clunio marinus]|nr:CLUMA_CG004160, isoform C [Clunio marinus]
MSNTIDFNQLGIVEPNQKIKHLVSLGSNVALDPNQKILRYYRSGNELYRQAKVYLSEGDYSNAYILFMRFLTLFVEKIVKHPQIKEVPADVKKGNKAKLAEILPITENLKKQLLAQYEREYEQYLIDQENEMKRALEEAKRQEIEEAKNRNDNRNNKPNPSYIQPPFVPSAPNLADLDQIVYPNEFPYADPPKSSGLLPGTRPTFDRSAKPSLSFIEGGLRTVKIPDDTMRKFLEVARPNTLKNVETCGILAGQLKQHQLLVTHVILPKQCGTSDSCNTMNEEEIFDIQDQLNLITLGWIHTHPSQTAFLSSVDLHTQAGYQIMMPE